MSYKIIIISLEDVVMYIATPLEELENWANIWLLNLTHSNVLWSHLFI